MISIIILVQDRYADVERCLKSIVEHTTHTAYELVLVLQGLPKDSPVRELCNTIDAKKVIIDNEHNTGVTPGRNQGIDASSGEYLLFFDDDAYVSEELNSIYPPQLNYDWLERMLIYYAKDPAVGIVSQSGSLINPIRPGVFWGNLERGVYCDVGQGYCFMFSRAVVNSIGKLDEFFGKFWHEESEYALRAKFNGFKVVNAGYVGVTHIGSGSGDDGSYGRKIKYMFDKWSKHFDTILEYPSKDWSPGGERIINEDKGNT